MGCTILHSPTSVWCLHLDPWIPFPSFLSTTIHTNTIYIKCVEAWSSSRENYLTIRGTYKWLRKILYHYIFYQQLQTLLIIFIFGKGGVAQSGKLFGIFSGNYRFVDTSNRCVFFHHFCQVVIVEKCCLWNRNIWQGDDI